jgi:hypothetical protein
MTIQEPHQLNPAEVAQRVDNLLALLAARTPSSISHQTHQWNSERTRVDYAFRLNGLPVSGSIRIEPRQVTFEANLSPALIFFQQRIQLQIQEKLQQVLAA